MSQYMIIPVRRIAKEDPDTAPQTVRMPADVLETLRREATPPQMRPTVKLGAVRP